MTFENETIDLTQINFNTRHEFFNCTFLSASLNKVSLCNSFFEECEFISCDLSNCSFTNSTLNDCLFSESKLLGINWTSSNRMVDLRFKQSNLSFNVFTGLTLKEFHFKECTLIESDFSESILDKSDFSGSDLKRATFNNTSLRDCDLTEAINYSINPLNNHLKGAAFERNEALSLLSFLDIKLK